MLSVAALGVWVALLALNLGCSVPAVSVCCSTGALSSSNSAQVYV